MQRLQRKFGSYLPRTADEATVGAVIHEFFEADRMLENMTDGSKAWRDAWSDVLHRQSLLANIFETIYKPVVGATEQHASRPPGETPHELMQRTTDFNTIFSDLKTDLNTELQMIDRRLINPAIEARTALKPMKKIIKKREDKKLDYERYNSRAEALRKKHKRSDRENTALAKHEADLERSTNEYYEADDYLRSHLPRLTDAAFSILPRFLEVQIELQNTLLSQLYTSLHNFCLDYSFPSPPPDFDEIIVVWDQEFTPFRQDFESKLDMLQQGKAIHQPMALAEKKSSYTGMNVRNGFQKRTTSNGNQPRQPLGASRSSSNSLAPTRSTSPGPPVDAASKPRISGAAMAMKPKPSPAMTPSPANSLNQGDYFDNRVGRIPSNGLAAPGNASLRQAASNSSLATTASMSSVAGKKKPPPPPPKRIGSRVEYVTAIYDFEAQQAGDLEFNRGDRIRITKKTGSTADWWEGELRGVQGSFPANYVGVG